MNIYTTWKPIFGFEDLYMINLNGDVKSTYRKTIDSIGRNQTRKEHIMTQFIDRAGYWTVKLTQDRRSGTKFIHRLLAMTFLGNMENKEIVNHINGNKLDNGLENLEWATRSENQLHAIKNNLCKSPHLNSRPVFNRCTGKRYPSIKAFSNDMSIPYANVKAMLQRNTATCVEFAA